MPIIYTDGSCIVNTGKGGWAFIAVFSDYTFEASGGNEKTTNNIMEITAVIEALKEFEDSKEFTIYSDSQYVINCAKGIWKRKKNIELWKEYHILSKGKKIEWIWVRGHSGNKYNEIVDKLAREESTKL